MPEKKIIRNFRLTKIAQLIILIIIEVAFFTVLFLHPELSKTLYSNHTFSLICAFVWIFMVFSLAFLLLDFYRLRSFAEESHALKKAAYLDNLTGIPNRHGLDVAFEAYDTPESLTDVGCFMVTIENLNSTNETLGRATGDLMIQHFCSIFEELGDQFGIVGRNGGNEFVLIVNSCTDEMMKHFIELLNTKIDEYNNEYTKAPLRLKYAYVLNNEQQIKIFQQLLMETYKKLHLQ